LKPRFNKHQGTLIKSTTAFERLNIDFKEPLPTKTRNSYILTVIDEYSRFPFAIPCPDTTSSTVIKSLTQIFNMYETPAYIHSDRGTSFISQEVKNFLTTNGIASSRTTPYNPQGNGQAERYNGIIWKTVQLALKNRNLPVSHWEDVLNESLYSIRSLLCTAINETPHERMFKFPHYHLLMIETPPPSHEQDYTPSDPTPLQNSPAPTVETPLPQNSTTPQSITVPPPQNVAPRRSSRIRRLPAYFQDYHLGEG
ncbi:hypothetical protein ILUMI_16116, partial [Ignelater luminosus]